MNGTTIVNGSVYGTMIIQTNETASLTYPGRRIFALSGTGLAMVFFFSGFHKRKRLASCMLLAFGAIGVSMMSGCGETLTMGKVHTSTFTLTAQSGSVVLTQTITLNVNNLGN